MSLPDKEDMMDHIMLTSELSWPEKVVKTQLEDWLSNFTGKVYNQKYEQELMLWLLTNFVYYNQSEVRHLCKTLYKDFIHNEIKKNNIEEGIEAKLKKISKSTMFIGLGRSGESGGFITYYFSKENEISHKSFIDNPMDIKDNVKNIVFIDDVTLSAGKSQAIRYMTRDVESFFKEKEITLLTLVASEKAIQAINDKGYNIINCVTLSNRNKCFSPESNVFQLHKDHLDKCKNVALYYGKKLNKNHPLGHKDSQLLFGFFYNTPNNSLPILWSDKDGWKPIIKRYSKNYGQNKYNSLGKFI